MTISHQDLDALCRVGASAVATGLVIGSGGNLSLRDGDNGLVVTGKGTWLDSLTPDQFAHISYEGDSQGDVTPSSEWRLHARVYQARKDVQAVVHIHPQFTLLLTALGHKIRFITQDHAFYVGSYGQTKYWTNGSDELADTAAEQLSSGEHNVVVMGHHGICAVGDSIQAAYRRALNMEEAAKLTYHALLLGDTDSVFPPEELAKLHHQ